MRCKIDRARASQRESPTPNTSDPQNHRLEKDGKNIKNGKKLTSQKERTTITMPRKWLEGKFKDGVHPPYRKLSIGTHSLKTAKAFRNLENKIKR
jgi:hypothetical protein